MVQSEIMPNKKQKIDKSKKETTSQIDDKSKRIKKRKNKFKKPSDFTAKLPQNSEDFSCNWKKLMTTIEKDPKKANNNIKKRPSPKKDIQISVLEKVQKESKKPTIWFDDVDTELLDPEDRPNFVGEMKDDQAKKEGLVKEKSFKGLTKILAMDCEMVGVGYGGKDSILARASIVNHFGNCVYDKYVKPTEKVTDYRTKVSGIRPEDIKNGEEFKTVQKEISDMLTGRVLIGHSIKHDLKVLFLDHPKKNIRDTSMYKPFRSAFGGKTPSLKNLTSRMLGVAVQEGEHSSVQDAQATMRLYTMFRKEWENELLKKRQKNMVNKVVPNESQDQKPIKKSSKEKSATQDSSSKRLQYEDSDSD